MNQPACGHSAQRVDYVNLRKGTNQAVRGGFWRNNTRLATVADHSSTNPSLWLVHLGFRIARTLLPIAMFVLTALPSPTLAARKDWTSPTLGMMNYVPAGTFTMGSPTHEDGRKNNEVQHRVRLTKGFWMMEHEVTQGEWESVMGNNPSFFKSCGPSCPVEQVSWDDIQVFIENVSARDGVRYQLPSEAEWEYAARGGQSYIYAGSDDIDSAGWYWRNAGEQPHQVCQKQRNGYGLCDMSGNVWEWVRDLYASYPANTRNYLNVSSGSYRVFRGGGWASYAEVVRVAIRAYEAPSKRYANLGFRLARTIP